jgi:signal transduction histidine kinase/ActR/RegA family two-component response regulator
VYSADTLGDVKPPTPGPTALLAPIALERARAIAPFSLAAVIGSLVLSEPTGVQLSGPVFAWNGFAILALGLLCAGLIARRVPVRYGHLAMAAQWWFAIGGTLVAQYFSGDTTRLSSILLVEVGCAAISLETSVVVVSFVVIDLLWVPMVVRDLGSDARIYISGMFLAQLLALVFQRLHRNALLRAERAASELAHQLDERDRLQEQLLHAQRMETSGTLAAGLAHDMNNILGSITSYAELLRGDVEQPNVQADLDTIIAQAARGADLTRALLTFSRRGHYRKHVLELDHVLGDVVPLLSRTLPKAIEIRAALCAETACIVGDGAQIHQVLVNLGVNAAHAMNGNGLLTITSAAIALDEATAVELAVPAGPYVRILVADTGSGMDEPTRKRVFEPFFTTKPLGKGTGLGLSMVWGIVQSHGGAVRVDSELGKGTTFTLYLPITDSQPSIDARPAAQPEATRRATVLVVDDETAVRTSTMRLLQRRGLDTLGACNGEEALEVFAKHARSIGLVILDMGMPQMGGPECFAKLRKLSSVPVLIATGYAVDEQAQELVAQGAALIEKPFPSALLVSEVTRLLAPAKPSSAELAHRNAPVERRPSP